MIKMLKKRRKSGETAIGIGFGRGKNLNRDLEVADELLSVLGKVLKSEKFTIHSLLLTRGCA